MMIRTLVTIFYLKEEKAMADVDFFLLFNYLFDSPQSMVEIHSLPFSHFFIFSSHLPLSLPPPVSPLPSLVKKLVFCSIQILFSVVSDRRIKMILLGKRPRPPIRRTTSMTGIAVDLNNTENPEAADNYQNPFRDYQTHATVTEIEEHNSDNMGGGFDQYFSSNNILAAMVSPRNHRRSSVDHAREPAHFLRTCGLCKRRLSAGRDIYMYRGDAAFCSQECREEQIRQDDKKEKCSVPSPTNDDRQTSEI